MSTPSGAFAYTHLNANGTTTIKSTGGMLAGVLINTKGVTGNTLTLYDNTAGSGTVIATIDLTAAVTTLVFNLQFTTGLTAVLANGTAADVTITWQ